MSLNTVSLLVLGRCFAFFTLRKSTCRSTKIKFVVGWRKLLRKEERGSTLSNKYSLRCSFFVKLRTCHATNLLMLRDKLKVFVSPISPPYSRVGYWPAESLLQLSFVLALLWFNSVQRGFSVSLLWLLHVRWRRLDLARWPNLALWSSFAPWPLLSLLAR